MPISTVTSEPHRPGCRAGLALLYAVLWLVAGAATAADAGLFIGQVAVVDARGALHDGHPLRYRIEHIDPALLTARLAEWIATPVHAGSDITFQLEAYPVARTPDAQASHLASSFLIDYAEPSVQALRERIESRYGTAPAPADLEQFVHDFIERKNIAHGFDVASVVARSRAGDCTEHAVLLTALLRMYGYPARTVLGVFVSLREPVSGFGHAWTEYRGDNGWVGLDGTRIDDGVGAHHIPLGVVRDESITYRLALLGLLQGLAIERITVE